MLTEFIKEKMNNANYKKLEDGTYFGEIQGIKGVWSNAETLEKCRYELREVLEEWILLKIKSGEKIKGLKTPPLKNKKVFSHA